MSQREELERWAEGLFAPEPPAARVSRELAAASGLPEISITAHEGQLIALLLRMAGCRHVVEIGTLSGYSALWILEGLPQDGHLYTLEMDDRHADVAAKAFANAGVEKRVTLLRGTASETLPALASRGPFDAVFVDADKTGYPAYLDWAEANLRSGGIVLGHNAFAFGDLHLDPEDPAAPLEAERRVVVRAMRAFHRRLADPRRFHGALIPTSEGLVVARRR